MYASAGLPAAPAVAYSYSTPTAYAPLSYQAPAYGTSSQNIIRSYDGTVVSQYAKAVDTPFSSVRKQDTRITNGLYSPGLVQYAAPAQQILTSAYPTAHTTYAHHGPAYSVQPAYAHSVQPAYAHTGAYAHPAAYSPATVVSHVSFDGLGAHYGW